ncbi:YfgG family protein [Pectobacterium cacticida]
MARVVLLISFIILLGRFAYSTITAFSHHYDKQQRAEQLHLPANDLINRRE